MIDEGRRALREGNRTQAQQLLLHATELDRYNQETWLWLAAAVDHIEEKRICLENVLVINKDNMQAKRMLEAIDRDDASANLEFVLNLEHGKQALHAGDRTTAQQHLLAAIKTEAENIDAWLHLAVAVATREDKRLCLETVLIYDPDHEIAQQLLAKLDDDGSEEGGADGPFSADFAFGDAFAEATADDTDPFTAFSDVAADDEPFGGPFDAPTAAPIPTHIGSNTDLFAVFSDDEEDTFGAAFDAPPPDPLTRAKQIGRAHV